MIVFYFLSGYDTLGVPSLPLYGQLDVSFRSCKFAAIKE